MISPLWTVRMCAWLQIVFRRHPKSSSDSPTTTVGLSGAAQMSLRGDLWASPSAAPCQVEILTCLCTSSFVITST